MPSAPNAGWKTLTMLKDGHRYVFQYRKGDEITLFYALMELATNDRFNITVKDLVHCTSRVLKNLDAAAVIDLSQSAAA